MNFGYAILPGPIRIAPYSFASPYGAFCEPIRDYRERVRQCEALGEFAMAEHIRDTLVNEQEHQMDLATALGEDTPIAATSK